MSAANLPAAHQRVRYSGYVTQASTCARLAGFGQTLIGMRSHSCQSHCFGERRRRQTARKSRGDRCWADFGPTSAHFARLVHRMFPRQEHSNRARTLFPLVGAKRLLRESMNHFTVHAIRLPGVIVGAFGRHFAARRNSTCSWHLAAAAETSAKRRNRAML